MTLYRKVGGMHWLYLGRLCIAWCIKRPVLTIDQLAALSRQNQSRFERETQVRATIHSPYLTTYTTQEHNHYVL